MSLKVCVVWVSALKNERIIGGMNETELSDWHF